MKIFKSASSQRVAGSEFIIEQVHAAIGPKNWGVIISFIKNLVSKYRLDINPEIGLLVDYVKEFEVAGVIKAPKLKTPGPEFNRVMIPG